MPKTSTDFLSGLWLSFLRVTLLFLDSLLTWFLTALLLGLIFLFSVVRQTARLVTDR